MKRYNLRLLVISLALVASGCINESVSSSNEGMGIKVEYLFVKDGVKVYRFRDGGRYHYFTTLGETISTRNKEKDENINPPK